MTATSCMKNEEQTTRRLWYQWKAKKLCFLCLSEARHLHCSKFIKHFSTVVILSCFRLFRSYKRIRSFFVQPSYTTVCKRRVCFQQQWHSFLFSSTWLRTETGGWADLLRCITLTDRLIVDKQLDSMPAPPRSSPLRRLTVSPLCCDLLELPRMTTMLHPSLSLRHKRGPLRRWMLLFTC